MSSFEFNGQVIKTIDGYLANYEQWTSEMGVFLAAQEGLEVTADHDAGTKFLRLYF